VLRKERGTFGVSAAGPPHSSPLFLSKEYLRRFSASPAQDAARGIRSHLRCMRTRAGPAIRTVTAHRIERIDMSTFQVDSEQLQSTTQSARATMERIRADVGGLMAQLTGLQSSWSGQASTAFQAAAAQWRATQLQVEQSLEGLNQALGVSASQYLEVEQANARLFVR
jgi:early secretory antigenic target protein ESAT-6